MSCSDRYQEGYDAGYSDGYYEGHNKGHEEGHLDGYMDGTSAFVEGGFIPSLGLIIIILAIIAGLYFIYMHYRDPTKRVIDKSAQKTEARRQEIILKNEIRRRTKSEEEIARLKAANLASKIFENSKKALKESYSEREVLKIKKEIEDRIFNAQSSEMDDIIIQYEKAYKDLKNAKYVNAQEKAELYSSLNEIIHK